jgi:hypothetical protein
MWRMYITLLNAWTHTKRWFPESDAAGETVVSGSPASDDREAAADMEPAPDDREAVGETAVSGSPTSDGREMAADMASDMGMETRE